MKFDGALHTMLLLSLSLCLPLATNGSTSGDTFILCPFGLCTLSLVKLHTLCMRAAGE